MSSTTIPAAEAAKKELAPGFSGSLIGPDDPDYEEARSVYNAMIDRRPALIARPTGPDDVAKAIAFARAHDLLLAVRGGGHNGAGLGTCDDGVVIDLCLLKDVRVDPAARTVRVGGGCTWGEVDRATGRARARDSERHHLDDGCRRPHAGWGARAPDAQVRPRDRQPARGGGRARERRARPRRRRREPRPVLGDQGRRRQLRRRHLLPLPAARGAGTVVAGPTFWPVEASAEVLSAYREFLPGAPRELNGFFAFHTVPPAPPFPEEIHLRKVCGVVWCYVGSEEDAAKAMAPLLEAVPEPLMHGVGPMPHAALQGAFDGLYPPGEQWYWRADFVKEIPDEAVEIHARFGADLPTMKSTMHMYPIDGAAHDLGSSDTAWSYRDAPLGLRLRRRRPRSGQRSPPSASGASTTSRRSTRTRPAAPT